jgi:acyl dehydratase
VSDSVSLHRTFSQADFDRFAALSGDDNPIHVDPAFSARTKFGRTVAHGVLLITVLTGLVKRLRPAHAIRAQDVRFPAPTFTEEETEFRAWNSGEDITFAVTRMADQVVTCDGRFSFATPAASEPTEEGGAVELTRAFSHADVGALLGLGGALPPDGSVPIPLLGAMFSYLLGVELPGRGTNYLKQQTRYLAPAAIGEPLTARVAITRKRPDKQLIDLSTTCRSASGSLICEGRALVHAGDVAGAFD